MQSLKLTIQFRGPLASALQSDTIFGQFCWFYRYIYGPDKLEEKLNQEVPFVVFSDGFLENHISMPILKPDSIENVGESKNIEDYLEKYKNIKKFKKMNFVKADILKDQQLLRLTDIMQSIDFDKKADKKMVSHIILRNSIDRLTNTTLTDGGLYQTEETFFNRNAKIDIYVKYNEQAIDKDCIEKVFDFIGQSGFGKDKSIGKGRFKIVSSEKNPDLLKEKQTKTFISLSSGVVCDDCEVLFGKTFVKFGKHGGYDMQNPFKKPVILFKAGSTFKIKNFKSVYGKSLALSSYKNHVHSAYLLPLFIDVEE